MCGHVWNGNTPRRSIDVTIPLASSFASDSGPLSPSLLSSSCVCSVLDSRPHARWENKIAKNTKWRKSTQTCRSKARNIFSIDMPNSSRTRPSFEYQFSHCNHHGASGNLRPKVYWPERSRPRTTSELPCSLPNADPLPKIRVWSYAVASYAVWCCGRGPQKNIA